MGNQVNVSEIKDLHSLDILKFSQNWIRFKLRAIWKNFQVSWVV